MRRREIILHQFNKIPTEANLARLKLHRCFDLDCYEVLDSSEAFHLSNLQLPKRTDNRFGDDDDDDDDNYENDENDENDGENGKNYENDDEIDDGGGVIAI